MCDHKGKFVSLSGTTFTMSHDDGTPNDTHTTDPAVAVTLNGKSIALTALQAGDAIEVCGDPVISIAATR